MRRIHIIAIIAMVMAAGFVVTHVSSCKKIDLTRVAAVATEPVSNITEATVKANGNVIDVGTDLEDYGFCWSQGSAPTINNNYISAGSKSEIGEYNTVISGLQRQTHYYVRSYIRDAAGVTYGDSENFTTFGEIIASWLHYDDGTNYDGIGYTPGGDWDLAIRFPSIEIQEYNGGSITRVKFIALQDSPTGYYVTIWEGDDTPDLILYEYVDNINVGGWTEYTLSEPHIITSSRDLWVGLWIVDQPADTYPAGTDNGPAVAGYGDLFSNDGGDTWAALSTDPPDLDYNWNLQFYVESTKGSVTLLSGDTKKPVERETKTITGNSNSKLQSKSQSKK